MGFYDTFISLLYGLVGITGALSVVALIWGFSVYVSRLGTLRRDEGLHTMEWAVRFVITSLLLIGLIHLVDRWFS